MTSTPVEREPSPERTDPKIIADKFMKTDEAVKDLNHVVRSLRVEEIKASIVESKSLSDQYVLLGSLEAICIGFIRSRIFSLVSFMLCDCGLRFKSKYVLSMYIYFLNLSAPGRGRRRSEWRALRAKCWRRYRRSRRWSRRACTISEPNSSLSLRGYDLFLLAISISFSMLFACLLVHFVGS